MKKTIRFLTPLLMGLAILASIFWYLFIYDRAFTRDSLLGQARFQDQYGNTRLSSFFYNAAYSFSGKDEDVAIELANQYIGDGNYTKAEYTLTHAINASASLELYAALSKTFVMQDKLVDAVNLLNNIRDPELKAQMDALRPSAPWTDHEAGYYNKYIDLHLSSSGDSIYYTTDGDFPSIQDPVYETGITLPAGETTLYAVAVNKNGLVSPATVLAYTVTGVIEEVTFTDPAMEAALRELAGVSASKAVMTNDLWDITEFTVPAGVTSLADLGYLPYLNKLVIKEQTIVSLSYLSSLSQLETLEMTLCKFPSEDLEILANLPGLRKLTLHDCGITTIADLAAAKNLTYLDLSRNSIRHLDALSGMIALQELNLNRNAVDKLDSLASLMELRVLDVSQNKVASLTPLATCYKLTELNAAENQISSLEGITASSMLEVLDLSQNSLTDVASLGNVMTLKELNLSNNQITDISAFSSLTRLEIFLFAKNQVEALPAWPDGCALITIDGSNNKLTSVSALKNMQSLAYVNLDYNALTSIDDLADCFCLVTVNVFGNEIEDVSKLREKDIIVNYDPTYKKS